MSNPIPIATGGWFCGRCGQYHLHGYGCWMMSSQPAITEPLLWLGWRCPTCGAGNAPWVGRCVCTPLPQRSEAPR
jgi:hypothetical protein